MFLTVCFLALLSFSASEDGPEYKIGNNKRDHHNHCPHGWTEFKGNCYMLTSKNLNWLRARFECRVRRNYGMAIIKDQETNDFIQKFAASKNTHEIWLGLNDKANEQTFVWEDGQPLSYSNWGSGDPQGADKDCVVMHPMPPLSGQWHTQQCFSELKTVCQLTKDSRQ